MPLKKSSHQTLGRPRIERNDLVMFDESEILKVSEGEGDLPRQEFLLNSGNTAMLDQKK